MIYFTSDLHLGHHSIIHLRQRPFDSIIKKLKGKKILVIGNHDNKYGMYDESLFEEICYYKEFKYNHIKFVLFHYPIEDWNGMYHGSIHLHGHCHNKSEYNLLMKEKGIKRFDVGVDANDFTPVLLEDIVEFINNKDQE